MPELRIDPIVGRRVYVAEDRAGRPTDLAGERPGAAVPSASDYEPHCPFCAGNEAATPDATATVVDADGQWQVRVVPNKYPAVTLDAGGGDAPARAGAPGAPGVHEVIIESPRHLVDVEQLDVGELSAVLGVYRDRLRHWAADPRLRHGLIFKNSGFAAGASLAHLHSQLVALPYVADAVAAELDGAARYYAAHGQCTFCDLLRRELADGERVVVRRDGVAAFCAVAGRQPYETWILPEAHGDRYDGADDAQLRSLAAVLHDVLVRLHTVAPGAGYNLLLHTGSFDGAAAASYHWHWELVPRLSSLAGLELGAGVYINPLAPERAAQRLRAANT